VLSSTIDSVRRGETDRATRPAATPAKDDQNRRKDASVTALCNLCNGGESHHLFTKNGWQLRTCAGCGLVRVDPMPSREQVARLYDLASGYQLARLGGPTRYTRWEAQRSDRLAAVTHAPPHPGAPLLDVGCSTGDYLERARDRGWTVHGIELAQHLAVFARVKRGLPVEHGGIDDVEQRFAADSFTTVTLWDVVEHLPNPLDAVRSLHRALTPGGTLYLSTPNLAGWVPRFHWSVLRRLTGIWPHPEPPLYLHQFTPSTIAHLLAAAGFERICFLPDEIPLWYTSGFLGEPQPRHWLRGESGARRARAIYLTTLPAFLAARLFRRGDSMIVRATRPAAAAPPHRAV
jgi:2-polyprenyl-3-methyl-5-hydroxy-6-metoxy-1,4-benzoquinol methylase